MGFIVSLPFQTNLLIYQASWGRGFQNPYLTIALSAPEFFLILTGLLFLLSHRKRRWKWGDETFLKIGALALLVVLASLIATPFHDLEFHTFMAIKVIEALLLYILATNSVLKQNKILKLFIGIMTVEALLGLLQVLTQSSWGLGFLGEPSLSPGTAHLAKISWGGLTWIRAYGTFPHPNILGGLLFVSLLATFLYNPTRKHEREILLGIQFAGLMVTCSRSALLAFSCSIVILCFWYANKLKMKSKAMLGTLSGIFAVELMLLFWSRGTFPWNDPALLSRWSGYKEALSLFWKYPMGVGWNHYTLFLDQATPVALQPWDYQPVHNVYLLALTETGILSFILAVLAVYWIVKKIYVLHKTLSTAELSFKKRVFSLIGISVLIIGLFDHYWMSLEQGRLLLVLLWGMFSHFVSDPLHVFPVRKAERRLTK
jgi:hypothetical protein